MSWDSGSVRQVTEKQTAEVKEQLEPTINKASRVILNKEQPTRRSERNSRTACHSSEAPFRDLQEFRIGLMGPSPLDLLYSLNLTNATLVEMIASAKHSG